MRTFALFERLWRASFAVGTLTLITSAYAAVVGPTGYTNDFSLQPQAVDWATMSRAGAAADAYSMDNDVNAVINAAGVTTPLTLSPNNPPAGAQLGVWSQTRYLQTAPTGNRFTAIIGKFSNNSGTNATTVRISYLHTILGGVDEEVGRGTRVYFSTSGSLNSWTNLATFNVEPINTGQVLKSTNLIVNWTNGANFYVLWADDNAANMFSPSGSDAPNQIDNFSLRILAGTPSMLSPTVAFVHPTNNASFLAPSSVTLNANATDPDGVVTNVDFFADGVKIGRDESAPFSAVWNSSALGPHVLYVIASDDHGNTTQSSNINVMVYDSAGRPYAQISTPLDGATMEGPTNLTLVASAFAINGVTNVDFYGSNMLIGSTTGAPPNAAQADYQFQNNLTTSVGAAPALVNVGANQFTTAIVDGRSRTVLRFAPNNGLTLSPVTSVISPTVYTIAMLFSFDDVSSWSRILDFKNGATDFGLYIVDGPLYFYPYASGTAQITAGQVVQLVLTRDAVGNVKGYIDGAQQFTFFDSNNDAVLDGNNVLRFFLDDASEEVPGYVARIRFFNTALTAVEVAGLDRLPIAGSYRFTWNAPFGSHALTAVASDANGIRGTSTVVNVTITIPPTNVVAPTIAGKFPAAGATVNDLTTIQLTFGERVVGVDASDLLVNGVPASFVNGSLSNYTFFFSEPAAGTVSITWAADHGITDVGYPSNLAFNATAPDATWTYNFVDARPPVLFARIPSPGASVTNLTQTTVTFSEPVSGVDANDLLVNGTPAFGLSGSGSNYTFSFSQPAAGNVFFTWASAHGITDLAASPNPFDGQLATWSVILDNRTVLVQSNSTWRFVKGHTEASSPIDDWRGLPFNDVSWSNSFAPFYFGDPYANGLTNSTLLSDMRFNYTSIYLRKKFNVLGASGVTELFLNAQIDDGFILWINGQEVMPRFNVPNGQVPYNATALSSITEQPVGGAPYLLFTIPNASTFLNEGENVIAIHAFNQHLTDSTDFGWNAQLYTYLPDIKVVPPRIANVSPAGGEVFFFTNITVQFTEGVTGVNASDLLVNGVAATLVTTTTNTTYTFAFTQPDFGQVIITWAGAPAIVDFDTPPKAFDANGNGATFQYTLVNPSAPTVASQTPAANFIINALTNITVLFSEPVAGVNAADLLVNGVPATEVAGSGASYTYTFLQPAYGPVSVGWAAAHGIHDVELAQNPFDGVRQGNVWSYTLIDQTSPAVASVNPVAGSQVTNLTQVTVTFTEAVAGVNANDLLLNGIAATNVIGSGAIYTFGFAQANATLLNFTWVNTHGIRDLALAPNAFNAGAPDSTWSYLTPDTVAPTVVITDPLPFIIVRSLNTIRITFTEPVIGVSTNDLLINGVPALSVNGAGAGPYTFSFLQPASGTVTIQWATSHGIVDLATPTANTFMGGNWTYTLDPAANFTGKVLISEIMFNPRGGLPAQEWIELRNITASPISLAGWRFTRGVRFTFPNVTIPANGHYVVAADVAAFQANYPGVPDVVGGWTGTLANSDETIELESALGDVVNSVHYATEGDWARRERGHGASVVESITPSGNIATVRVFGHGFTSSDRVMISDADQPQYNGIFSISSVQPSSFSITLPSVPSGPATGPMIARHVVDNNNSGWSWFSAADGFGSSLELVNSVLPNSAGQNWLVSTNVGGTPGQANTVASANVAPLIFEPSHFPMVPSSTMPVTITAEVRDESPAGVSSVTLFYRDHTLTSPLGFVTTNMFDDGAHGDGLSGDGVYGAVLPPLPDSSVVEFYISATDTSALSRTWPVPTWDTNNTFGQLANALYQVSNEAITDLMPTVRVIMTGTERNVFPPSDRGSDAEANNTFIVTDSTGTEVRYLAGVRVRGAGSRSRNPPNNRVNIPNDNRWNDLQAVNLNGQFVHAQLMGSAVAQQAAVPSSPAHVIQYRINGINPSPIIAPVNGSGQGAGYGAFIMVQPVNGDLAEELFPEDGDGNVYRASSGNHAAQLLYRTNPDQFLQDGYSKSSNQAENDWSDMKSLTYAFSQAGSDAEYFQAMSTNVNVEAWMRYLALGTLMNYGETSLFNGRGDDYALYRGVLDPRFVPIGHDYDTVFGQGDSVSTGGGGYYPLRTNASPFIMLNPPNNSGNGPNIVALRRFMMNEEFAPIFFRELKELCDTVLAPEHLNPLFDQLLSNWGNGPTLTTIAQMKTHAQHRRDNVLAQIPLTLTVGATLGSSNGLLYTTTPNVTLFGQSHAIDTRSVLVNGTPAVRSAWEALWTNSVTLLPGINRVLVQSLDKTGVEFARQTIDIWYDDGTLTSVSGAITADAVWSAAQGPYQVTANVTVNSGATLTIQAGTTVYLNPGVNITVASGGRLLAEGTDTARIRFITPPGSATRWGSIIISGVVGSPESRITHAHIEGNSGTAIDLNGGEAFLDHLTFGTRDRKYLDLDGASFVVQNCVFPAPTAGLEPVHGTQGIRADGHGIVQRNFFGRVNGYNDAFDFTGGNRPGPILQVINNVFAGSDDDLLDFDSTDAWVEGNIFLHAHRNGSPDSASAISGGNENGPTSEITIMGNLFYNVDQAALAKQGNFYTMINNTIVNQNNNGSQDAETAVVILADDGTAQGAGIFLEANIISQAMGLTRNVTTALVTYTNNLFHQVGGPAWSGPGGNNQVSDPLFVHVPLLRETTNFQSWAAAQVLWDWLSLREGSPAAEWGSNGRDRGGVIPLGASVSGEPVGATPLTTATLTVGVNRNDRGVPASGFPSGSGFTHYKWRFDGGAWSAEIPINTPISLNGLSPGAHHVEVVGKNDAGFYQDAPLFGEDAIVAMSRTWIVAPGGSPVRINEVLAANSGALMHFGSTPDAIELYNASDAAVNLTGMRLTDELDNPDKFIFPAGASVPARGYLVVFANVADGTSGHHLGFGLSQFGESLYLFNSGAAGGALIDSVSFGLQLTDLSVGRLGDGEWALTLPTFGIANRAAATGDAEAVSINEWLAIAQTPFGDDFVELYNSDPRPTDLSGWYLTDNLLGSPTRHRMPDLTFMAGGSYLQLIADGDGDEAGHLNFSLTSDAGMIALLLPDLTVIDSVIYQPQQPNIAQGRNPNGGTNIVFLNTPTPGAPNPIATGPPPFGGALVVNEVLASNSGVPESDGRKPDWVELYNGTGDAIDLANFSLTDTTLALRKFVFSNNTVIAAGGYLRIMCDDGRHATNNNTGFGLRASGGAVYLFNSPANGGGHINSIVYGIQTPNLSIGRVPSGGTNWLLNTPTPDAPNNAVPSLGSVSTLRVNEWMAAPEPGQDDWFEIYNPSTLPVALGGLYLSDNTVNRTKHQVAALSFIGTSTNGYIQFHADSNPGAGADHVSFALGAGGESVVISTTNGVLIDGLTFGGQVTGVSQGRFPDGAATTDPFPGTGSPGASNWRRLATIAINEVLTHTDEPLEDAVELRNLTAVPIDVSGWWLSDDNSELRKYQIPSPTVIPANDFVVFYENAFTNSELAAIPFALSSGGDEVILSSSSNSALTGFRARVDFGAAANGVSFGRYVTSDGRDEFVPMIARTIGMTNAYPKVGPIVISEVMYHPPEIGTNDNTRDEFLELRNITTAAVPLYDSSFPSNTWRLRDAVDFDFPMGTTIPAGGTLLVVSFDPTNNPSVLAEFRSKYQLAAAQAIVGPYSGKLANDTDDVELRRPDAPNADEVPYVLVERVRFFDRTPWPPQADGSGPSLQRISLSGFGNDPTNWVAASPTPGPVNASLDSDGDGLPDTWETDYSFDPFNPFDALLDSDGDGLTNLQEFQLGTNPRMAASGLRLEIAGAGASNLMLNFNAVSNFNYSIVWADAVNGPWQLLQAVAAAPTNRVVQVPVSATPAKRFFRIALGTDSSSTPVIESIAPTTNSNVQLKIHLPPNRSCSVLFAPTFGTSWTAITNFPSVPTNRTMTATVSAPGVSGFYRLAVP